MPQRILARTVSYLRANSLGAVALFVVLGGTGYAAAGLHSHATSTRTPALTAHGQVVAWAIVSGNGRVVAGNPKPRVQGGGGVYMVSWRGIPVSHTRKLYCASPVTVDDQFSTPDVTTPVPQAVGYADATNRGHTVYVGTFNPSGQQTPLGFEVALICPAS